MEAVALVTLAETHLANGRLRQAERVIGQALAKAAGQSASEAPALLTKAKILCAAGKPEGAAEAAEKAVKLYTDIGGEGLADAYLTQAEVFVALQEIEKAKAVASQAVGIHRKSGDKKLCGRAKAKLAAIVLAGGFKADFREAATVGTDAVETCQSAGDKLGEAMSLAVLARAQLAAGKLADSAALANDAVTLFKEAGDKREQAKTMVDLARAQMMLGDSDSDEQTINEAIKLATDAVSLYQELRDKAGEAKALQTLAVARLALSQTKGSFAESQETERCARKSQELYWSLADKSGVAYNWLTIAQVRYITGDTEDALQTCMVALNLFKEAGNGRGVSEAKRLLELSKVAHAKAEAQEEAAAGDSRTSERIDYWIQNDKKQTWVYFDAFTSREARRVQ